MKRSIANSEHYVWGDNCEGSHLHTSERLSVIQESMPPGTREKLHFHKQAEQFFYVLEGEADFTVDGRICRVYAGEGIAVYPGQEHYIANPAEAVLRFLLVSQPGTRGDRFECEGA